ncbi:MAG: FecR domain-containing protein [Tannerella sp.]|jgi:ferric-dicitrate binding protein FerR (iron transport regulator)|nr:FecR domain-containing protein [Tannerella sp.]
MEQIPADIESMLIALFSGEATDSEVKILREWLDASPEHRQWFETYRKINFIIKVYRSSSRYDAEEAWRKVMPALGQKPSRGAYRWMKRAYRYAAVVMLSFAAGMGTMYFYRPGGQEAEQTVVEQEMLFTEYTVPYGSKSMVILPDSSSIWMNAGSKLRYSSAFNREDREVFVEGEAYFKVARNEGKPFLVRTSAVTLKVLGTSFNVKAYPEEDRVETTVESGSVQVLRNVAGQLMTKLILTAGEKATVIKATQTDSLTVIRPLSPPAIAAAKTVMPEKAAEKTIVAQNVTTELYTSWKDARWLIEKELLEDLAVKLERRYNVRISFADEALKKISFSGTLKDETLEQVLEAIKLSAPVNYTVRQNQVKLSRNKWVAPN